jgi:adenine-specific DNA-methyltransferase
MEKITESNKLIAGDSLDEMAKIESGSIQLIITSPPYNIGKEYETVVTLGIYKEWIGQHIIEFHRILAENGSVCFQVGNYIEKGCVYPIDCLCFEMFIQLGFKPRNRIIWHFGHGLHCKNRFSGRHETILWFTKSNNYVFNLDPVRVPSKYPNKKHFKGAKKGQLSGNPLGKNPSDVWDIPNVKHNHPEKTKHQCQFPEALSDNLVLALSNKHDMVLDPFCGSGTALVSAVKNNRQYIGIDLDKSYIEISKKRLANHPQNGK